MAQLYLSQHRGGYLIAASRLFLAAFCFLVALVDRAAPRDSRLFLYGLLGAYALYALLMMVLAWRRRVPARHRLLRHVVDLVIVFLVGWLGGPVFPFFVFLLFAGSLRWQRRGALLTGAAVLVAFIGMGLYETVFRPAVFDLNTFGVRGASLLVTAVLLAGMGGFEVQVRHEMQKLAGEPDMPLDQVDAVLQALLWWAASIMANARAVIVWEENDEPWLHVAWWKRGEYERTREPPGAFEPLVAGELADVSFLCEEAGVPDARVLRAEGAGCNWWRGEALNAKFRLRFSIKSVISMPLRADTVAGRLFLVDRSDGPRMTSDDLVMGNIIAHRVSSWLNRIHLARQLAEVAALDERIRVARDLHDGAFHGLTGVALELERLLRVAKVAGAEGPLRDIQQAVVDTQRTLRMLIGRLKGGPPDLSQQEIGLVMRLNELCRRLERQWGLRVEQQITGLEALPASRSNDVYLFVHEALVNVARHAGASVARLELAMQDGHLRIVVADDGCGFASKGRPDPAVASRAIRPATLKERAALLGGGITIESTDAGTRLEISFPVGPSER